MVAVASARFPTKIPAPVVYPLPQVRATAKMLNESVSPKFRKSVVLAAKVLVAPG